ncbi:MAG: histidine phosphatase family protein [Clostridia bacterium]|nr:histidine phosphatase family protein [Clostridia bacterium]
MTKIYLVRHCEAVGNKLRLFQGTVNLDITPLGAKQLEFLTERFKDIKIDCVYTSPLIRAQKTAFAVLGDRIMDVKIDNELREINAGIYDGKPFKETFEANKEMAEAWFEHPQDFAPEGGEPMRHAYERVYNAVKNIADQNPGKTVVLALHGGIIRCLMTRFVYGTIERLGEMPWAENTAVSLLTYENGEFTVEYRNDTTHLPEEYLPVRNRLSSFMSKDEE